MGPIRFFRYSQLGVLLAALVLLAIFALAVRTVRSFRSASDVLLRTQEVRVQLADTFSDLKDVLLQTRTYLSSGDERALAAQQQSLNEFNEGMATLRRLMAADDRQRQALHHLDDLMRQLMVEYEAYVALRRTSGPAAVTARYTDGTGKRLLEETRTAAIDLQALVTRQLEAPLSVVRSDTSFTLAVLVGGLVLDVLLVIAVIVMLRRDYRARESAAAALRRQSDEIKDLYNRAPCGYHSLDADGLFVAINDTELSWLGYTREEMIRRMRMVDLLPPASRPAFQNRLLQVQSGSEVRDFEVEVCCKDGRTFPALINGSAILDASGRFVATRAALFNLTERKQIETDLQKLNASLRAGTAELEAANRELEAFSYSVSHDLRAPLRHIDYFSTALQKHLPAQQLDPKAQRYITTISNSARNMGRLIDDLLSFARIARTEMRHSRVRLDEIVREIRQELHTEINGRNVAWMVSPLPEVEGDPSLLRQVFANLLSNAVKYTRPRAEARIEITTQPGAPDEVVILVRDNGAGFDMKYADKLFGVFQRLHASAEFEGTGVGLANVRRIIERHHGRIWAEAAVDRGATFYFSLPATRRAN